MILVNLFWVRWFYYSSSLLIIPLLVFQMAEASSTTQLSLQEAVRKTLGNSPEYFQTKNNLEQAELESRNTFSAFFPTLDLTATHGLRDYEPDPDGITRQTRWRSEAALVLTENLYDNGETYKRYEIFKLKWERARLQHHKIKAQIIRRVILAYYRLLVAEQDLEFVKKNFAEIDRLEKMVREQYHQGLKKRKEMLSFKTRAQRSRLEVLRAQQAVKEAHSQLLAEMGEEGSTHYHIVKATPMLLPPTKSGWSISPQDLYDERILRLVKRISEYEVELSRRRYWPELNLVASAQYGSSEYVDTGRRWSDNDQTHWGLFLNLKFNLIDWGVRQRNIRITQVQRHSEEQAVRLELLRAQKEVEDLKFNIDQAQESYNLASDLQKTELETFQALERDYKSGLTSYLELITGLSNLLDAQSRFLQTQLNQADLYLSWKYHKGILDEKTAFE